MLTVDDLYKFNVSALETTDTPFPTAYFNDLATTPTTHYIEIMDDPETFRKHEKHCVSLSATNTSLMINLNLNIQGLCLNPTMPITLKIDSNGGYILSAESFLDRLENRNITSIGEKAHSCAAPFLIAATMGQRFAYKNCKLGIHAPRYYDREIGDWLIETDHDENSLRREIAAKEREWFLGVFKNASDRPINEDFVNSLLLKESTTHLSSDLLLQLGYIDGIINDHDTVTIRSDDPPHMLLPQSNP